SISVPCGYWGGQVGEWMRTNVIDVVKAYKLFCIGQGVIGNKDDKEEGVEGEESVEREKVGQNEKDEWDTDMEKALEECEEYKSYNDILIIVGRKPREDELVDTLKNFKVDDFELKKLKVEELEVGHSDGKNEDAGKGESAEELEISDEDLKDKEVS
ncbi:7935_t:CDS:1, partial [Acaulospora morrowiae]